jgi:hypothetical protein
VSQRVRRLGRRAVVLLCAACMSVAGCTGTTEQPAEVKNLQVLASLYGRYVAKNRGQPPADEAALRKFIPTLSADEQVAMGVDAANLDKLFISPRDGQPYIVRYKGHAGGDIVAYERVGKNGKRMVAHSNTQVEEVDEATLKQLVPDAK